jgi:tripartite-type tricarboxylate transporter receptor subunit TctC
MSIKQPASTKPPVLAAAVVMMLALPPAASADPVADFYKGKQVRLIVGAGTGGGFDVYARTFARYLGEEIPGRPNVIVQNMQGAASVRAANYLYNVAAKDGTVIAAMQSATAVLRLYGEDGQAQYEPQKFNWVGSLNNETSLCVSWHTSPIKSIHDVLQNELIIGGAGANDTERFPHALNNLLGTKFKIISGYVGANIDLAMERREVDGRCGWAWSSLKIQRPDWVRDKKVNVIVQLAAERDKDLPNVPFIMDVAKNERDKQALNLIFAPLAFARPYALPPDVPRERVAAVRDAFARATANPNLLRELEARQLDVGLLRGEAMHKLLAEMYDTPKDIIERATAALKR